MKVRDIMQKPVVIDEETTIEKAARIMITERIGCLPVVNAAGEVVGIVTEADLFAKERGLPFSRYRLPWLFGQWVDEEGLKEIYRTARTITVKEIMTMPPITIGEEEDLEALVEKMLTHKIKHVPVVQDGKPVGIVGRRDLIRLILPAG